ncbi:hypothetical protein [Pseudomonas phage vB_PsaM_M1]|nr:hypothetical protein [Pseudomonas phage vB_PsaM_M1]
MTEYERFYRIDDIPNYPTLFIRDGDFVFVVNKHTGEISNKLTLMQYVDFWREEWEINSNVRDFYTKGLFHPKQDPDTATNLKDLKKLCSDNTRHRKGDTGYLLDFIMLDQCSKTESKVFLHLCKKVIVWSYCTTDMQDLQSVTELKSSKQVKAVWKSLQDKGLLCVVNTDFDVYGEYKILVKLHPRIYWEGRYSAWAVKCKADYEYEDSVTLD